MTVQYMLFLPQQNRPSPMVQFFDEITNDQIETVQERINKLFKNRNTISINLNNLK
jgi:hypothetical protein